MSLLKWFQSSSPPAILLLDGGVSTYLESVLKKKNQVFSHRSLWSSSLLLTQEGRQDIYECHCQFYKSGANLASTVTYQCYYQIYNDGKPVVDESTMTEMMQNGVRLAQKASATVKRKHPTWVVASTGCYGAALADGSEYTGNYGLTMDQLVEFHRRKAQVLLDESPDALAFETIPCSLECQAIMQLLRELPQRQGKAVWMSLACQNGNQLNDGNPLDKVMDTLSKLDPDADLVNAIGVNCCDIQHVSSLVQKIAQHMAENGPKRGIVMYPNSGEQWDAKNEQWLEGTGCTTPNDFASQMMDAIQIVHNTWQQFAKENDPVPKIIVGGCCRTSSETIQAIRKRVDEFNKDKET